MKFLVKGQPVWINLHHLYYFYIVVEQGSLAHAANFLNIGQPTLSSQLKNFEQCLGVELFDRSHKRLVLTKTGTLTHKHAGKIFKSCNDLLEEISPKTEDQAVQITIGVHEAISSSSVMEALTKYASGENVSWRISQSRIDDLVKRFKEKEFQMMITNQPLSEQDIPGVWTKKIDTIPVVICGAPNFAPLVENFPYSLSQAPFIFPLPGSKLRAELELFFKIRGITTIVTGETRDMSIQKQLAIKGSNLIAAPLSLVKPFVDNGQLVIIGTPENISEDLYISAFENLDIAESTCAD